jgi:hypothetical protein
VAKKATGSSIHDGPHGEHTFAARSSSHVGRCVRGSHKRALNHARAGFSWLTEKKAAQYILKALRGAEEKSHKRAQLSIVGPGRYKSTLFQIANERA